MPLLTPSSSAVLAFPGSPEHDQAADPARCDAAIVRRFVTIVSEHATRACAGIEGYLQVSRVHPADDKFAVSGRFERSDIEHMLTTATADAGAGFNCYIEARIVTGATAGKRGKASETAGVWALVIDSDADTGKAATTTLPPTLKVQTSPPDNWQGWYFLRRAISAKEATEIGAAVRHHTGGDQDTGVPTQPYRIAGTPNFPNRPKQARGRVTVPTRILEHTGKIYSAAELCAAFPQPKKAERKNDAEDNIEDQALAALVHYLGRDEAGNQSQNDPSDD